MNGVLSFIKFIFYLHCDLVRSLILLVDLVKYTTLKHFHFIKRTNGEREQDSDCIINLKHEFHIFILNFECCRNTIYTHTQSYV